MTQKQPESSSNSQPRTIYVQDSVSISKIKEKLKETQKKSTQEK